MSRIALITGGNRGLGRASALALGAAGTDVVITYRSHADEAAEVVAELTAMGRQAAALRLDTTEFGAFAAFARELAGVLAARWGRDTVDALVNNAGAAAVSPLGETSAATVDFLVDVHFKSVVLLTQELLPLLADGGRVLNTSTGLARFTGPGYSVYGSVKAAVETYTRYLAQELGPRGIAVNVLAPGPIATDFAGGALRDDEGYRAALAARTAMGRVGSPDDIGGAVAAILAPGAGWVTGQRIEASGGSRL
ncbi:SDR family NAD(P)-dependent oxidoreductase [Actinokineospora pegani]|uniref:SDR family NAD(P)-dependent oxidoreductase n=1 Tax=Actinokineospora pegani TaxID=2654637 RepID=UPI0012EA318E|nr:SDR family oxidoreductase [Actinokineospora pegani]